MIPQGYKQTEIGVIPEEWFCAKIEDIATISMCKRIFADQTTENGDIPFYKIGTFGKEADAYISVALYNEYRNKFSFPKKGDVLISAAGTLGRTVIYDGKDAYFQDSNIVWLDIDKNVLCNEYLNHYYRVTKWASSEGSTIARLYNGIIYATNIALPPLEEQKRIAEALSDVDSMISSLEKLIAKKKSVKQGAMQELLTGKKRLPGFAGEWKYYHLSQLGVFTKGSGISRDESNSGTISAVRYGELYTKHNNYITKFYSHISEEVANNAKRIYYGDILFAASGETKEEIGKCAAITSNEKAYAGGDILIFRPHNYLNPLFMGTVLNMPEVQKQRAEKGQGDAIVHIHAENLSSLTVLIPEIDEQNVIASILSDMDNEIESLEQKLTKARQIKQGMTQQLLTGKIRLV
ncbi:MAG: restriction endonuclease subunit S [Clostridia bacterium]|nr:restriction endonuclease subunit S [Clostridia bacterium]